MNVDAEEFSLRKKKSNQKKMQEVSRQDMQRFLNFSYKEHIFEEYYHTRPYKKSSSQQKHYYLRAKFKFIVDHEVLPDISNFTPERPLEWGKIEQVIFATTHEVMCPICLSEGNEIIAPQITTCGHIFCWPCFLRHSEISNTKKKCPLCGEVALKDDLKIVRVNLFPMYNEGNMIQFTLVIRKKGLNVIYDPENGIENIDFSRIIQVNKEYIRNIILQEKKELDEFLHLCHSSQEYDYLPAIEEAYKISDSKLSVLEKSSEKSSEKNSEKNYGKGKNEEAKEKRPVFLYSKNDNFVRKFVDKNECLEHSDQFYFIYQESEGQLIFLHPLNYKYLMIEYGTSDHLPLKIEGKIQYIDHITLTEKIMQRYKFLSHLPQNTDAKFVEIFMDNLLNKENLKNYKFEMHEFRKKLREKEEALIAAQESQSKKYNKNPKKNSLNYEEQHQYFNLKNSAPVDLDKKIDTDEYPELPKVQSLSQEDENFKENKEPELEQKPKKEEKKIEASPEKFEEKQENKQYYLSDYIFGEVGNVNLETAAMNKKSNNKKGKKNKKIILFSTSMNHY